MIRVPRGPFGGLNSSSEHRTDAPHSVRRSIIVYGAQGLIVVLALLAVAWAFGILPFGGPKHATAQPAAAGSTLSVSTVAVAEGSITGSAHLTGTVQSAEPLQLTPAANGKLVSLPIKEGSKVSAGQVVASLLDTGGLLAQSVATAQSTVAQIRASLDRLQHPTADSVQVAQARASVKSAAEVLKDAKKRRSKAESDLERAQNNYDDAVASASASASKSAASASRSAAAASSSAAAAASSSAAAASRSQASVSKSAAQSSTPVVTSAPVPSVTVTVTAPPPKPTGSPTRHGLADVEGDAAIASAADDASPTDVNTAASDLAAAKSRLTQAKDAVTTAQENYDSAKRTLAAYSKLDPAAQSQIDLTQDQLNAAEAQYAIATQNLAALTVRAPASGTVTSVPMLVGSAVTTSSVIAQIDSGGYEAKASTQAAVAGALQAHPTTPVKLSGTGLTGVKAAVRMVSPTTDSASDQTDVTFTLLPPKKTVVRPGATVGIDLTLPSGRGLIVPASSVLSDGPDTVVYTVTPGTDGFGATGAPAVAHRIKVIMLSADATNALVAARELTEGSQVVVTGQTQLADGTKVQVLPGGAPTSTTGAPTGTGPSGMGVPSGTTGPTS
jgi:RND family efflux transporter MFP subunit